MDYRMVLGFVLSSTFGAFEDQQVIDMSSNINAKSGIERSRLRGGLGLKKCSGLVARRGVRGKVTPWVGGSE